MIRSLLLDRGRKTRFEAIRAAHRRFDVAGADEPGLIAAVCEALCASGGYRSTLVVERRQDGTIHLVKNAGASLETPVESLPCWTEPLSPVAVPAPFPVREARAVLLSLPVGGDPKLALVVVASPKTAFGPAEMGELGAIASRIGHTIEMMRLAARLTVTLDAERDFGARLLELVPVPVVQLGPEGEIRRFNRRSETLTGFRSSEVIQSRMADLLLPEPLRSDFRRLLVELFIGRRQQGASFPLLTRSGEIIPLSWTFSPIRAEGGGGRIASILACGETTNVAIHP